LAVVAIAAITGIGVTGGVLEGASGTQYRSELAQALR
jgi:hypothetical protein